jgi:rubrerythrin
MKLRTFLLIVIAAVAFFAIGRVTADTNRTLNQKTLENLATAMHGEAFAYAKYMLYAQQARQNGNTEVADLFEQAARTERFEHFAEEAELAKLVGSDRDNLNDAIRGESYEVNTMYSEFGRQAKDVGDNAVADRLEEIRHDEMRHRDAFKAALDKLELKPIGQK